MSRSDPKLLYWIFVLIHSLIKRGQAARELNRRFGSRDLAYAIYGQMNIYVMAQMIRRDSEFDRRTAARIVEIFLAGAAAKK